MLDHDDRGVLGTIGEITGLPEFLATILVQCQDSALLSTGCAEDTISVDQYGFGVSPAGDAATERFNSRNGWLGAAGVEALAKQAAAMVGL